MNKKKRIQVKKEYTVIIVAVVLFIVVSALSVVSMWGMQSNARVTSYVGYVSGGTLRLVKNELLGHPDDALMAELDAILNELLTGEGELGLKVLNDDTYLTNLKQVKISWEQIKGEIQRVRDGADGAHLNDLSEEIYEQMHKTVQAAQQYTANQLVFSSIVLLGSIFLAVFVLAVALVLLVRSSKLKKKADMLNKIAYFDPLTKMPNRASSEKQIDVLRENPPSSDIAVFMFDMNNLKTVNNLFGRNVGDKLIAEFGRILGAEAADFGFVGRYGGDEFIAIFMNADEDVAGQYLTHVNEKIVGYNLMRVMDEEKISFSVGYCIGNMKETAIDDMITEAERRMYVKKRQIKGIT